MNNEWFFVSYLALWGLTLLQGTAVLGLYRYFGKTILDGRQARASEGPSVARPLPSIELRGNTGIRLGSPKAAYQFIYCISSTCGLCVEAFPVFCEFALRHASTMESILVYAGPQKALESLGASVPTSVALVTDRKRRVATGLGIYHVPFAVLVDSEGIVHAKGMPSKEKDFAWFWEQVQVKEGKIEPHRGMIVQPDM